MENLVFLKLGGSLITDKSRPYTPRGEKIADLARQIAAALTERPEQCLLLGHGSGSFGHTAAKAHDTRRGLPAATETKRYWRGFAEVGYQAARLNRLLMGTLHEAGLPAMAFPPSASVTARNGQIISWELAPLRAALDAGILPVVYGDAVFDEALGGTILSTEDLFAFLAREMRPRRILLAGLEEGVWESYPERKSLVREITPGSYEAMRERFGEAEGADVTGGMASKVAHMVALVRSSPELEVCIFSGEGTGNVRRALLGETLGTLIRHENASGKL